MPVWEAVFNITLFMSSVMTNSNISPFSLEEEITTNIISFKTPIKQNITKLKTHFNFEDSQLFISISVKNQKLYLVSNNSLIREYDISTAKNGVGFLKNSDKTPLGTHRIAKKIGDNAPIGTIFRGRQSTGKIAPIYSSLVDVTNDDVTSRILWLDGQEENNQNSISRFIYIHGTPEEGLIGQPASHGCIRMRNKDVIELFDLVDEGIFVEINN